MWGPSPAVGYGSSQTSWNVNPCRECQRSLHVSSSRTAPAWVLSMGCSPSGRSQLLPENLLQQQLSMSSSLLMSSLPALAWLLHRLQCEFVAPWSIMGYSGTAFLTIVFSMGLPSLLADLGICSVFSCIFLNPLCHSFCALVFNLL